MVQNGTIQFLHKVVHIRNFLGFYIIKENNKKRKKEKPKNLCRVSTHAKESIRFDWPRVGHADHAFEPVGLLILPIQRLPTSLRKHRIHVVFSDWLRL